MIRKTLSLIFILTVGWLGLSCPVYAELCPVEETVISQVLSPAVMIKDELFKESFSGQTSLDDIKKHMFSVPSMQDGRTLEEVYRINQEEDFFSAKTLSVIDRAGSNDDCAVLDIGAGKGVFLKGMVGKTKKFNKWVQTMRLFDVLFEFHAFEIKENEETIRALQDKAEIADDADFMELQWTFGETAENLPKDWENKFTFIFATRSIEYCRDPLKAIEEIYRVLKPGGQAVVAMSLINKTEYSEMVGKLNSEKEADRLDTIGHVYFDGVNLSDEIQRLKTDYNIELFASSDKSYQRVKVDDTLMQRFLRNDGFAFNHFVIVLNKEEGKNDLKFDYILERAYDPMRRKYISKDSLLPSFNDTPVVTRREMMEQSI